METLLIPLKDRHFLWFAGFVATMVFAVSFMGQFATLFLIQKLQVNNTQVQLMLIAAPMLAQLAVLHVWGKAADRMGKKPMLAIAALGLVPVGAAWVLMNSGAIWLGYVLSMLGAALWVGVETANFNLVMQFSGSGEDDDGEAKGGSGYVAVNSVIVNIAGCAGGLLAGWIATLLRDFHWETGWLGAITYFEILFFISAALRLLAVVVFLPRVHEPEARPTMETLRFMTTNIYNNLFSAISVPLRLVKAGLSSGAPDRPGKKREG
jgi:MFS family permease